MEALLRQSAGGVSSDNHSPLVSIVCLTFNQEKYIAQAIESFLSQKTTFPFDVIVHDDASSDKTLEIVKEYQSRYPDRITVLAQTENLYSKGGHVPALAFGYAMGAFIAYCEGDDYWCDPHKIQRQAQFLLCNPQHGVVFTNSRLLYVESNRLIRGRDRSRLSGLSCNDATTLLLLGNPYTACTSMFRAEAVKGYEEVARRLHAKLEDLVMWLFIAGRYRVGFLSDVTAVYRVHARSASHFVTLADIARFEKSAHRIVSYFNRRSGYIVRKKQLKNRYRKAMLEFCLANRYFRDALHYTRSPAEYVYRFLRVLLRKVHVVASSLLYQRY